MELDTRRAKPGEPAYAIRAREPARRNYGYGFVRLGTVFDIGYCGYSEPFGGAGEGHTGLRMDLARSYMLSG